MSKLVLIGGPPGVGKTSVLEHLPGLFDQLAILDADDVWRVQPGFPNEVHRNYSDENVISVLRGYLDAGFPLVFLSWVLANPIKLERILAGLRGHYDSSLVVYLVASRECLQERAREKYERGLAREYQLAKLEQIEALPHPKIDTTGLTPEAAASQLAEWVRVSQE